MCQPRSLKGKGSEFESRRIRLGSLVQPPQQIRPAGVFGIGEPVRQPEFCNLCNLGNHY
jgi:hypothetical protein